jgi:hypothetical protein
MNVAYMLAFHKILVTYHHFEDIGGQLNTCTKKLELNGKEYGKVFKMHRQNILEYY